MMPVILADTPVTMTEALTNFGSVLTQVATFISNNAIMMTMFAGGLLVVGAKVFKRIKNASK